MDDFLALRRLRVANHFINCFHNLQKHKRVLFWLRVSEREQKRKGNLDDQDANLQKAIGVFDVTTLRPRRHIGSGVECFESLAAAAIYAKANGAVLLAETTDRYLRHPFFECDANPDIQPTLEQFRKLSAAVKGVPLFTHLAPDACPRAVRSYQRKRGQWAKGRYGGGDRMPGWTTRRRNWLLPFILAWHRHLSLQEIADRLKREHQVELNRSVIHEWIQKALAECPDSCDRSTDK